MPTYARVQLVRFSQLISVLPCVLISTASIACNETPPAAPSEQPEDFSRGKGPVDAALSLVLGLDASDIPVDPQPPSGDFKEELGSFTTLDAFVEARQRFDPVVGDAIDALGYDTLSRDACRVLDAARNKDSSLCDAILSTSLKQHCQATVAVTIADPFACPMRGNNHDAVCVALARRDDRLCDSVVVSEQPTCRAVLARDPLLCGRDDRCRRKTMRLSSFLPEKIERPDLGTRASVQLIEYVEGGTLPGKSVDLSRAIVGVTVRMTQADRRIEIGESSSAAWSKVSIGTRPRFSFRMNARDEFIKQGKHAVPADAIEMDLLVPRGVLVSLDAEHGPMQLDVDKIGLELGDPVRFVLEADAGPSYRKQRVRLVINTFVRDVVMIGRKPNVLPTTSLTTQPTTSLTTPPTASD